MTITIDKTKKNNTISETNTNNPKRTLHDTYLHDFYQSSSSLLSEKLISDSNNIQH